MSAKIAVLGAGSWGTTLAVLAARAGCHVALVVRDPEHAKVIELTRVNLRAQPGLLLPDGIRATADLAEACGHADLTLMVVPSQQIRDAARLASRHIGSTVVVSAAKGLEQGTLKRMTEVLKEELAFTSVTGICALSGPNLAAEIAAGKPAVTVVASESATAAAMVRDRMMSDRFRVYTNDDVIGVELGGALKNIVALGAGMADGLDVGDNAKAAFITRGLAEIVRLGVALGAKPLTFAGLSGLGDLVATCASPLSRNHRVGRGLAAGKPLAEILSDITEVAEGVTTTQVAYELGQRLGISLPITETTYRVLFEGLPPRSAIDELMLRSPTGEFSE